jgi:hypothetical protein
MTSTFANHRARACLLPLPLALLLAACGGGGDGTPSQTSLANAGPGVAPGAVWAEELQEVQQVAALAAAPTAAARSGLQPRPPQVIDSTPAGERVVKAVGALDGGGYAVAWMARGPLVPGVIWELWAQRFDAEGQRVGPPVRLDIPAEVYNAQDVAVNVLPEGRIGVTFVTLRRETGVGTITEVHHWPYNLQGTIDGMVRVLDAWRNASDFFFAGLSGPLETSTGRDGSLYVSWRFRTPVTPQLVPSVRAQRLAADGEPLGWIQRLDGQGESQVSDVNLTALDDGGWVAAMERVSPVGVPYRTFTQLEVPRPLSIPLTQTHAAGAFLLDLRGHGSVLFTANVDPNTGVQTSPRSLHFTVRGVAQPARDLPTLPVAAIALRGGDYLTLRPDGAQLSGQRYTARGEPVGHPFTTPATSGLVGAGLARGGLALAWTALTPEGQLEVRVQLIARR